MKSDKIEHCLSKICIFSHLNNWDNPAMINKTFLKPRDSTRLIREIKKEESCENLCDLWLKNGKGVCLHRAPVCLRVLENLPNNKSSEQQAAMVTPIYSLLKLTEEKNA